MIYCTVFGQDKPDIRWDATVDQNSPTICTKQNKFLAAMDTNELLELKATITFLRDIAKCACVTEDMGYGN